MKSSHALSLILALGAGAMAPVASAIEPIPQTPGWRGFVVGGMGYTDLKSNLVAGNGMLDIGATADQLGQRCAAQRRCRAPDIHWRGQLHVREPVAGIPGHFARGRRDAGRRGPVRVSARTWATPGVLQAGYVVQRHPDPGLGRSVCRRRRARGDRSRFQRNATAMGPDHGLGFRAHGHVPRHLHRATSAAGRACSSVPAMRPARTCCGATAISTPSTSPTCTSWGTARATCCARCCATRSTTATARR